MAAHIFKKKDPFRIEVALRLWELESFIRISQDACEESTQRTKTELEEAISKTLPEDPSMDRAVAVFTHHPVVDYVVAHHEAVPRYLAYSFVAQVYNLFEDLGRKFHKELMQRNRISDANELQSRDFLKHFAAFTDREGIIFTERSALDDFKEVRNNVVHRGGYIAGENEKKREKLQRIVETNPDKLSLHQGQIEIVPDYAVENLALLKQFFSNALDQVKFEDGYWWLTPSKKSITIRFDGIKPTIDVTDSGPATPDSTSSGGFVLGEDEGFDFD
jgi:hypothetical protein